MTAEAEALLLALGHHRAGRLAEAAALYDGVLAREPAHPQALHLSGLLLLGAGDAAGAGARLTRAAEARPRQANIWRALAQARINAGEPGPALDAAEAALALEPDDPEANFLRGTALSALGRKDEAIAAFGRTIARAPRHAAAHLNLGNALADLDRLEEAERFCRAAIACDPGLAEAHASLGFVLTSQGRLGEAIEACDAAIRLSPDFAQAHFNRATAALLAGDFAAGFAGYEWRKRHDRFRCDFLDLPGPAWQGEDIAGRTILVNAEQGLGDTIQLSRYIPLLAARGATVRLACDARLIPLLAQLDGLDQAAERGRALPDYDVWIDQMSLPRAFGTTPETVPAARGYLRADDARMARWEGRLPQQPRVGIVWAGNPTHSNDRRRSLPAACLVRLLATEGLRFVSLQVGPRSGEATASAGLSDHSAHLSDYAETAALVASLDLVVTVDTSVAHLAGALGIPVWVMLPFAPDWRWILGRDDTPWYDSMRLFRQVRPGAWDCVIGQVTASLAEWRNRAPCASFRTAPLHAL